MIPEKTSFKPGTMVNPVPVAMVSCGTMETKNIITIAWTGIVNSEPPLAYISVRKSRLSHGLIAASGEFGINLCTEPLAFAADWCGVKSGRDVDKFAAQNLTAVPATLVSCPLIAEAPVNIECRVREVHEYPSHDMFVAEVLQVHADSALMDEDGRLRLDRAGLICYNHGEYFALQPEALGKFGFSVMKPKTKKRLEKKKRAAGHRAKPR